MGAVIPTWTPNKDPTSGAWFGPLESKAKDSEIGERERARGGRSRGDGSHHSCHAHRRGTRRSVRGRRRHRAQGPHLVGDATTPGKRVARTIRWSRWDARPLAPATCLQA